MRRLGLPLATFLTLALSVSAQAKSPGGSPSGGGRSPFPGSILAAPSSEGSGETWARRHETAPVADRGFRRLQERGFWARGGAGLLVRGDERGVEISGPSRSGVAWKLGIGLAGLGRGEGPEAIRQGTPAVREGSLEFSGNGLTEWYRSGDAGIEQGFRIERAPEGGTRHSPVTLEMALAGGLSAGRPEDGGPIRFRDLLGRVVLESSRPRATDAAGTELPVELVAEGGVVQIRIEDGSAVYPIQVDAMLASPAGSLVGETGGDGFGRSVAAAGDVNGDGYGDVIVGAPLRDNGSYRFGRAYLFTGSAEGIGSAPTWVVEGSEAGYGFAAVVAGAGDLNGDGFGDVVVSGIGRAHVYLGSASGLSPAPDWTSPVPEGAAGSGVTVAGAGDVNSDGFSDLLVGAPQTWVGAYAPGRVELYLGSASGPVASPAWVSEGDQPGAGFGYAVASAGDVNADGYGDVIVGEPGYDYPDPIDRPNAGKVLVYLGSSSGLSAAPVWESALVNRFAFLGASVSGAGDVNGDGYDDVLLGGFNGYGGEQGIAQVYLGSSAGPSSSPAWIRTGDHLLAHLGTAVAGAGDLDGDGYGDVVVGEPDYDRNFEEESVGRTYAFRGSAAGLPADPSWFAEGDSAFVMLGNAVASAGDVNGDGAGDLVVGLPTDGRGTGRVFLYAGAPGNRSPEARISAPAQVECASSAGAVVNLSGSGSSDPDSIPGTQDDIRSFEWFEYYGQPGQVSLGSGESLAVTLSRGDHLLTLRVSDSSGATGTAEALVTVADTTPPHLTLTLSSSLLWPPTHRMVPIHATVGVSDACGSAGAILVSVTSDEPDDAPGPADGSTLFDIQEASPGTPDFDFKLRAERSETGNGRVYTVIYRAVDAAGNPSTGVALVSVPFSFSGFGGSTRPPRPRDGEIRKSPGSRQRF